MLNYNQIADLVGEYFESDKINNQDLVKLIGL